MGVIIPTGSSQAVIRWAVVGDSELMVCVLGFTDTLATLDPAAIAVRFQNAYVGSTLGAIANIANSYSRGTTLVTTMLGSGPVTVETGTPVSGTNALAPPPNNCAILVRKNTSFGGRRNRGRMFLPPAFVAETDILPNGVISNTAVTAMNGHMASLLSAMALQDLTPKLFHSDGAAGTTIDSMTVQARLATQRQRMRR